MAIVTARSRRALLGAASPASSPPWRSRSRRRPACRPRATSTTTGPSPGGGPVHHRPGSHRRQQRRRHHPGLSRPVRRRLPGQQSRPDHPRRRPVDGRHRRARWHRRREPDRVHHVSGTLIQWLELVAPTECEPCRGRRTDLRRRRERHSIRANHLGSRGHRHAGAAATSRHRRRPTATARSRLEPHHRLQEIGIRVSRDDADVHGNSARFLHADEGGAVWRTASSSTQRPEPPGRAQRGALPAERGSRRRGWRSGSGPRQRGHDPKVIGNRVFYTTSPEIGLDLAASPRARPGEPHPPLAPTGADATRLSLRRPVRGQYGQAQRRRRHRMDGPPRTTSSATTTPATTPAPTASTTPVVGQRQDGQPRERGVPVGSQHRHPDPAASGDLAHRRPIMTA